jgi:hypothetical protein
MKQTLLTLLTTLIYITASAQFVARMEIKEPIPGLCNMNEVYALFPSFKGQEQAVSPLTKEQITEKLNNEVQFLKDNPTYSDKGMIGLVINCKGEVVKCEMDNKTKTPELDKQIEAVFNTLGAWQAGKLNKKEVDTSRLFSFSINNGLIKLN